MSSPAAARTTKQQAHELIDELPDGVSWQELAYSIEVRADIEAGLADVKAGRVTPVADVRREFGLPE
jgi:predicted transcriptional regulator